MVGHWSISDDSAGPVCSAMGSASLLIIPHRLTDRHFVNDPATDDDDLLDASGYGRRQSVQGFGIIPIEEGFDAFLGNGEFQRVECLLIGIEEIVPDR